MRKLMFLTVSMLYFVSANAYELPKGYTTVGTAKLSILWFEVYNAELSTPDGSYLEDSTPVVLKLDYLREIKSEKLLQETEDQLKKFVSAEEIPAWLAQLADFWPSVSKGDQIAFYLSEIGHGYFFFNGEWIGTLESREFSKSFLKIWLSDQSSYPKLAKKLRGENDK